MEDLSQTGRHGTELRPLDARRQLDRAEPLGDDLSTEIDVRAFLEDDGDLRETEFGERADFGQPRQP
jgi:hypothetical protein